MVHPSFSGTIRAAEEDITKESLPKRVQVSMGDRSGLGHTKREDRGMRRLSEKATTGLAMLCGLAAMSAITGNASAQADDDAKIEMITLGDSLQPVIDRFNAEKDKPRIVALLSPT